jgi:TPP-dependent pyruvate/acetoin dehydrogenase alpha subunit
VKCFTYLSSGQEWISAAIAAVLEEEDIEPYVFAQHRNHAPYLCFGGDPLKLKNELLGLSDDSTSYGVGGDPCHADSKARIIGHIGLIADQVPVAVGHCFGTREPTVVFLGDGAVEEDYFAPALGIAAKHKLPILFVVEDNDLSVLTPKSARRDWQVVDVAKAYGLEAYDIGLNNIERLTQVSDYWALDVGPMLLNVHCKRKFWHVCFDEGFGINKEYQVVGESHRLLLDILKAYGEAVGTGEAVTMGDGKEESIRSRMENLWKT